MATTYEEHQKIAEELGIENYHNFSELLAYNRHQQRIKDTADAAREVANNLGVTAQTVLAFDILPNHTERLLSLGKARRWASDGKAWMAAAIQAYERMTCSLQGEEAIEVPVGNWDREFRHLRVPESILRESPDMVRALVQDEDKDPRAWRVPTRKIIKAMAETICRYKDSPAHATILHESAQKLAQHFDPIASALAEAEEMEKDKPVEVGLVDAVEFAVRPQTSSLVLRGHFSFNSHNREEVPVGGEIQSDYFADWYGEGNHEQIDPILAEWGLTLKCPGGNCPLWKDCDGCEFDGRWVLVEL